MDEQIFKIEINSMLDITYELITNLNITSNHQKLTMLSNTSIPRPISHQHPQTQITHYPQCIQEQYKVRKEG